VPTIQKSIFICKTITFTFIQCSLVRSLLFFSAAMCGCVCVCMCVLLLLLLLLVRCYRFSYTRMNFYSICKATTSCTIAVLNTQPTNEPASKSGHFVRNTEYNSCPLIQLFLLLFIKLLPPPQSCS